MNEVTEVAAERRISPKIWVATGIFAVLVVFSIFMFTGPLKIQSPANLTPILTWTDAADKMKAAALLNQSVSIPGFKAEVYTIDDGDNFWVLAKQYKVKIDTILALNPELQGISAKVGDPILIANTKGALHQVQAGDTIESIAAIYACKPADIKGANRIGLLGLKPMQLLFIPGGAPKEVCPALQEKLKLRGLFRAPLYGVVTSYMGMRIDPFTGDASFHNGVDFRAKFNAPVAAAAAGTVILAGWNGGFGKCIKIDHHNGYITLYGHLNKINVHVGEQIKQNQPIGFVGETGRATGPHLHFTIYYQGKVKNPEDFLW